MYDLAGKECPIKFNNETTSILVVVNPLDKWSRTLVITKLSVTCHGLSTDMYSANTGGYQEFFTRLERVYIDVMVWRPVIKFEAGKSRRRMKKLIQGEKTKKDEQFIEDQNEQQT